jgi:hypothetical protein
MRAITASYASAPGANISPGLQPVGDMPYTEVRNQLNGKAP